MKLRTTQERLERYIENAQKNVAHQEYLIEKFTKALNDSIAIKELADKNYTHLHNAINTRHVMIARVEGYKAELAEHIGK
jgi:hypothetical protein